MVNFDCNNPYSEKVDNKKGLKDKLLADSAIKNGDTHEYILQFLSQNYIENYIKKSQELYKILPV